MSESRALANGEVWELRGQDWHMLDAVECSDPWGGCPVHELCYYPVKATSFDSYARAIEAQARLWYCRFCNSGNERGHEVCAGCGRARC